MTEEQKQALIEHIETDLELLRNVTLKHCHEVERECVLRDIEVNEIALAALNAQPVACKKRLVNHRSGVAHHWTYHGEVDRPSSGDIFRVEVVPLYEHPAPAAELVPEGWKMVPVEPTKQMLEASYREASVYSPTAYRAMLAAAPTTNE